MKEKKSFVDGTGQSMAKRKAHEYVGIAVNGKAKKVHNSGKTLREDNPHFGSIT